MERSEYTQAPGFFEWLGGFFRERFSPPHASNSEAPGIEGSMRFNPVTKKLEYYPENAWEEIGTGGGSNVITGTQEFTGDGKILTFLIPHGQTFIPQRYNITPMSVAAQGIIDQDADGTNLIVTYDVGPVGLMKFEWLIVNTENQP